MGAALLRHALAAEEGPLRNVSVISAGVSARGGEPPTDQSVIALKKVGIDLTNHISQPLTQELVNGAMAVICMTDSHRAMVRLLADPEPGNLILFREFVKGGEREIADPYGCPLPVYEASRDEMVEAIPSLVEFLRTQVR
jgi:protein-tyrosine phosphatase